MKSHSHYYLVIIGEPNGSYEYAIYFYTKAGLLDLASDGLFQDLPWPFPRPAMAFSKTFAGGAFSKIVLAFSKALSPFPFSKG